MANVCYLSVSTTGAATLADDTGVNFFSNSWVGYGYEASPSNSHCALNGPASSFVAVARGGTSEQVTLNLTFNQAWKGKSLSIWLQSQNTNYKSGSWQQFGTFTVGAGGVPSFTLNATAATVQAGSSGSSTITVTPLNGFNSAVTLSASGWPVGITGTLERISRPLTSRRMWPPVSIR